MQGGFRRPVGKKFRLLRQSKREETAGMEMRSSIRRREKSERRTKVDQSTETPFPAPSCKGRGDIFVLGQPLKKGGTMISDDKIR